MASPTKAGTFYWDNPRKIGTPFVDENNEISYAGPLLGRLEFATLKEMKSADFLKGGSAILSSASKISPPWLMEALYHVLKLHQQQLHIPLTMWIMSHVSSRSDSSETISL
ncbi:hypothetical protein INR49_022949 [Caranx melampygus]|nr:hypothetical protein INR49_022949 [Caranx melampygus]